ncbi:hypothetical protein [Parvibaculum sp.]|uniref:hypothetical protein n=1 Tax=Parvibaculum sp. TaxID=2024848 RepID=UPI00391BC6A6
MARLVPLHVGFSIATVCIRAMLAAYGIPSAAPAFHHIRNNWFFVMASGGIEVHVFEHDAEAARMLILPVEDYVDDLETEPRALLRSPFRVLAARLSTGSRARPCRSG